MKTKTRKINSFPEEVAFMFLEDNYWKCWLCDMCHANCGHHIFGRGHDEGPEKSVFNFAPLNNHFCHLPNHGYLMTKEGKKIMLQKTIKFLEARGYTLKEIDIQFLNKYGREINSLGLII